MKRILLAFTVASACVALAGCTGDTPVAAPSPSTTTVTTLPTLPSADPQLVTWLDGFCGAVGGYLQRSNAYMATKPATQTLSMGEAQVDTSKDLGQVADNAGKVVDEIKALPTVSDPQTEAAKKSALDKFTAARERATQAKAKLDAAKRGNVQAVTEAGDTLAALQQDVNGSSDPLKPFAGADKYLAAVAAAPKCKLTS